MAFNERKNNLTGKANQHKANADKNSAEQIQSQSIIQPFLNILGMGNNEKCECDETRGKFILKSTNRFYFFAVKTAIEYLNKETGKKWSVDEETKDNKGVYLISSEYVSKERAESDAKKVKKNIPVVKEKLFKGFNLEVKET